MKSKYTFFVLACLMLVAVCTTQAEAQVKPFCAGTLPIFKPFVENGAIGVSKIQVSFIYPPENGNYNGYWFIGYAGQQGGGNQSSVGFSLSTPTASAIRAGSPSLSGNGKVYFSDRINNQGQPFDKNAVEDVSISINTCNAEITVKMFGKTTIFKGRVENNVLHGFNSEGKMIVITFGAAIFPTADR